MQLLPILLFQIGLYSLGWSLITFVLVFFAYWAYRKIKFFDENPFVLLLLLVLLLVCSITIVFPYFPPLPKTEQAIAQIITIPVFILLEIVSIVGHILLYNLFDNQEGEINVTNPYELKPIHKVGIYATFLSGIVCFVMIAAMLVSTI